MVESIQLTAWLAAHSASGTRASAARICFPSTCPVRPAQCLRAIICAIASPPAAATGVPRRSVYFANSCCGRRVSAACLRCRLTIAAFAPARTRIRCCLAWVECLQCSCLHLGLRPRCSAGGLAVACCCRPTTVWSAASDLVQGLLDSCALRRAQPSVDGRLAEQVYVERQPVIPPAREHCPPTERQVLRFDERGELLEHLGRDGPLSSRYCFGLFVHCLFAHASVGRGTFLLSLVHGGGTAGSMIRLLS